MKGTLTVKSVHRRAAAGRHVLSHEGLGLGDQVVEVQPEALHEERASAG